jgi:thiosulfate dehydrogenase
MKILPIGLFLLFASCSGAALSADTAQAGKLLLDETKQRLPANVGNGLNCSHCHLNSGTVPWAAPYVGLPAVYPQYSTRDTKQVSLADRINDCFERSMNGKALALNSTAMKSMLAYMASLPVKLPDGKNFEGRGLAPIDQSLTPNLVNGQKVYVAKCAACHGVQGQGIKAGTSYAIPPLWGNDSFNDGAGMARTYTAAAFVKAKMPPGAATELSAQDAVDVAQFFTHQARPVYPGKAGDWAKGGRPKDARN